MAVQHMPPDTTPSGGDDAPTHCPFGHKLAPGRVLVGWSPCDCAGAAFGGHRTFRCRGCEPEQTVMYEPEHRGGGFSGANPYPKPMI